MYTLFRIADNLVDISTVCLLNVDCLCGLEFLATDSEARVRFPALPEKKSSGSGTGSTQPREYN
jgi:hypothetical protein